MSPWLIAALVIGGRLALVCLIILCAFSSIPDKGY
jgi:hypothetical protein